MVLNPFVPRGSGHSRGYQFGQACFQLDCLGSKDLRLDFHCHQPFLLELLAFLVSHVMEFVHLQFAEIDLHSS